MEQGVHTLRFDETFAQLRQIASCLVQRFVWIDQFDGVSLMPFKIEKMLF